MWLTCTRRFRGAWAKWRDAGDERVETAIGSRTSQAQRGPHAHSLGFILERGCEHRQDALRLLLRALSECVNHRGAYFTCAIEAARKKEVRGPRAWGETKTCGRAYTHGGVRVIQRIAQRHRALAQAQRTQRHGRRLTYKRTCIRERARQRHHALDIAELTLGT